MIGCDCGSHLQPCLEAFVNSTNKTTLITARPAGKRDTGTSRAAAVCSCHQSFETPGQLKHFTREGIYTTQTAHFRFRILNPSAVNIPASLLYQEVSRVCIVRQTLCSEP